MISCHEESSHIEPTNDSTTTYTRRFVEKTNDAKIDMNPKIFYRYRGEEKTILVGLLEKTKLIKAINSKPTIASTCATYYVQH